jgi:hypothetical protein
MLVIRFYYIFHWHIAVAVNLSDMTSKCCSGILSAGENTNNISYINRGNFFVIYLQIKFQLIIPEIYFVIKYEVVTKNINFSQ